MLFPVAPSRASSSYARLVLCACLAGLLSSSALAQTTDNTAASTTASSDVLQEVVVTAQFRRQDLQQTPIAITAVNAAMLEQRNQTDISQVAAQAPNVTLQPNGAAFGSSMVAFIRGIGQTDFDLALEPGVGIYVDDVYYATLTGSLLDLLDLDRVEILRGPQGTLAGKNSIGGAIKLFTKKPTGEGGYLEGSYGSLHRVDARGAGDFTLIADKLFARLSFVSKHHDGYVTRVDYGCTHPGSNVPQMQLGDGCVLGRDGDQAFDAARMALRWLPTDTLEVNLAADATNDKSGVQANTVIKYDAVCAGNPPAGPPPAPGLCWGSWTFIPGKNGAPIWYGPRPTSTGPGAVVSGSQFIPYGPQSLDPNHPNDPYLSYATYFSNAQSGIFGPDPYAPVAVPPINHYNDYGLSSDIRWQLADKLTLASITAYRYYDNQFAEQTDASPVGVQILLQRQTHSQLSEELRLNGSIGTAVDYTLGGFFMNQFGGLNARVGLPWIGFDFVHGPDSVFAPTRAAFFNADWHATDKLTFDAGVRYSKEKKTYTYYRHNSDGTDIPPTGYNSLVYNLNAKSATFSGTRTDYRAAVEYQITPDVMTYVQTSTGYKGGGVNPRPFYPPQTLSFNPETLTAYEAGLKTNLFDRRMRLNLAAFYNNYKDIQLTLGFCPEPGAPPAPCALPANVGSAHVYGFELETEMHPVGGLEIDASASYIHFNYTQITDASTGVTPDMVTPYTPKEKASIGAQYEFRLGNGGTVTPRLDASYQSSEFTNPINDPLWNQIDSYTVLNGRLTWQDKSGDWQTSLAVTNLTNKVYYLTLFDLHTSTGYVNGQPAMPREWLVTVKRTFN
jgi:iron complex outermembrane recepter protein